jgi:AcrR family transcriptional regulator
MLTSRIMKKTAPKKPQRRRRKEARPTEIVVAAIDVFAEKGFRGATLDEVARRAGVAKGTVFVYFATKEELFRAVAQTVLRSNLGDSDAAASALADIPLQQLVPVLLSKAAAVAGSKTSGIIRALIAEAEAFPDLAKIWHDEVVAKVLSVLTSAITRAQALGSVSAGNARLYAFSIMGPMLAAVVFRQIFQSTGTELPDTQALAAQHAKTVLNGILVKPNR